MTEPNEWTIMFQLAGDGLISAPMISQLKAITDAGFRKDTNVLVYFDPNCNRKNARIFNVNGKRKEESKEPMMIGDGDDPYVRNIAEDCHRAGLDQIPATLSLRYFLEYSRTYYPARNYMLFLMGHGVIVGNDAFLPDPDDQSAITLRDLGRTLRGFGEKVRNPEDPKNKAEFHLVGFHSCSMSSVEVAYELQGSARYMLGTQGMAFPGSWPYRQLLKKIFCAISRYKKPRGKYPNQTVREILTGLQDLSFYNSVDFWLAGFCADLNMCCLDERGPLRNLDSELQKLAAKLREGLDDPTTKGSILRAHLESQSYWGEQYTDLCDLCDRLVEYCDNQSGPQQAIADACKAVIPVLKYQQKTKRGAPVGAFDQLVVFSDFYGPAYQFSNGLSIYFPWRAPEDDNVLETYGRYQFCQEGNAGSEWLAFLKQYFDVTERKAKDKQDKYSSKKVDISKVMPLTARADSWTQVPDHKLLSLGTAPDGRPVPSEQGSGLEIIPSDKQGGGLTIIPSDKQGGGLMIIPSDKQGGGLEIIASDKQGGGLLIIPSDKQGGGLEIVPSDKQGGGLAIIPSDKQGGGLAIIPSDKQGGGLALISDKQSGTLAIFSDKQGGTLASISDKPGGVLAVISDKQGGVLAVVSDKPGGTLAGNPSDKPGGGLSDKQGGEVGLSVPTVIKNFEDPKDFVVTSRPGAPRHKPRKGKSAKKET